MNGTVICEQGEWYVEKYDGIRFGPFESNAAAWRWIERVEGEPISSNESRHQFGWDKFSNGE